MKGLKFLNIVIAAVVILLAVNTVAVAQKMGPRHGRHWEKRQKNLENLRMLKLLELLDLSDEQSPKFIELFVGFRKDTRQIDEEIQKEIESLGGLLKTDNPPDDEIREKIRKIDILKADREDVVKKFHDDALNILTVVQMGRMVVFEERFELELIERIQRFREGDTPPSLGP
jgi:Spy/CpxP family protein refolding chaperone